MEINGRIVDYISRLARPFADFLKFVTPVFDKNGNLNDTVVSVFKTEKDKKRITDYKSIYDFDMTDIFKILFNNWKNIDHNNDKMKIFDLYRPPLREMRKLRNQVAHQRCKPIEKPEKAYQYLDTILKFAKAIGAEKDLCHATRKQLVNLIEQNILLNAEKKVPENKKIQNIVKHTREYLYECDTAIKVEFFYWNNIINNKKGWYSFKLFVDNRLTTFEYIRQDFYELCTTTSS
ncbi:hypothetical protein FACS189494_07690 [Spirochaetia bacterium]|nr:hypothetical protein FACS189494_07690 [Spirochaetia bacterium]